MSAAVLFDGYRPLVPGETLGGFTVEREFMSADAECSRGPGNPWGTDFYIARSSDGTPAMLKVSRSEWNAERLRKSAASYRVVTSRHIPRLLGCGDHWLAIELIRGPLVLRLLRETAAGTVSMEPEDTFLIGLDVLAALEDVHRAGLVHGDAEVSEHWILDGEARGFLLHLRWPEHTERPKLCAPEQCRRAPYDHRADIYTAACGIATLYGVALRAQALAAERARGANWEATGATVWPSSPVAHPPSDIARVLARASAHEPAERHHSVAELRAELLAAIAAAGLAPDSARLRAAVAAVPDSPSDLPSNVLAALRPNEITFAPLDRFRPLRPHNPLMQIPRPGARP